MLILSEKKLRRVIREELANFLEDPSPPPDSFSIKSKAGGEIIIPNHIKELFEEGKVKSLKDII